jgi:hypothetical protein
MFGDKPLTEQCKKLIYFVSQLVLLWFFIWALSSVKNNKLLHQYHLRDATRFVLFQART